jgi:tetratricopeptide (TPR) repeat protein
MTADPNPRPLRPLLLVLAVVAASVLLPVPASAAEDPREVTARAHFAKGEYRQALDLFATLFGEHNDPIYMRNIGRCYQKLGQPASAIDAFHEYLRRAPNLKPAEKQEIEGFIKEMEELKASQALAPPPAGRPPAAATEPPPTQVDLQPRPSATGSEGPAAALASGPPPPDEARPPIYKRWWFWTAAGAVVAGAVVTGIALSAGSDTAIGNCMGIPDCVRVKN